MKTSVTEMLGIKYPIVQGGMQWVGRTGLVAAVSNAGGLGILTALTQPSPQDLREEIQKTKCLTKNPFGVNLTILPTRNPVPYDEYIDVIIESGIKVIETAGRSPAPFLPKLKAAGVKVIHKATSLKHCLSAEKAGVDIVSVDGFECAGHPGETDIPGLVLLARAAEELTIPFIASGGFANGRGLVAALALGAAGINMGTRFVVTQEAPVHENIKQFIVDSDETDTVLIFRTLRNTGRVLRNPVSEEVIEIENRPGKTDFADIAHLVVGARGREGLETGDINKGLIWAGLVTGLIHDIPTCEELISRMMAEAHSVIKEQLSALSC
ncbi:MAG: nitronate monooxygenase [Emcibacter sp.]|nr:nitronate monooxygenase [Emcibacter sp.]